MAQSNGFEWQESALGPRIRWARQPDIAAIRDITRTALGLGGNDSCEVFLRSEHTTGKRYDIKSNAGSHIMRIVLPVESNYTTKSEVATFSFLQDVTDVPMGKIVAHDATSDNAVGFEWILMEAPAGQDLRHAWRKMDLAAKEVFTKQLAHLTLEISKRLFQSIGSLQIEAHSGKEVVGRFSSIMMAWGDVSDEDFDRGPFRTSQSWLKTRLSVHRGQQQEALREYQAQGDEEGEQDSRQSLALCDRVADHVATMFPPEEELQTCLSLCRLSTGDILVKPDGEISCIIDLSLTPVLPLWASRRFPLLLCGKSRHKRPDRTTYSEDDGMSMAGWWGEGLDNEGVTVLYWEHLMEYEQTLLRKVFIEEMRRLDATWVEEMERDAVRADLRELLEDVGAPLKGNELAFWLDRMEAGQPVRYIDLNKVYWELLAEKQLAQLQARA